MKRLESSFVLTSFEKAWSKTACDMNRSVIKINKLHTLKQDNTRHENKIKM